MHGSCTNNVRHVRNYTDVFLSLVLRRYRYQILAGLHPDKFGWTIRHYDELFLVLNAVVQQYYVRRFGEYTTRGHQTPFTFARATFALIRIILRTHTQLTRTHPPTAGGSLSEIFYGLTRLRTAASGSSSGPIPLGRRSRWLLFASLVLVPYLRLKLDALTERFSADLERLDPHSTLRQRQLKRLTIRAASVGCGVYECLQVLQYIAYMANQSSAHSLGTRLLRQQLAYADAEAAGPADWSWSDLWAGRLRHSTVLTTAVFRGLELSAFFLQFVRWWTEEAAQGSLMRLPVPEAPPSDANGARYMGICPLCVQSWEIPTAVSISGYVYCYKCIMRHLEGTSRTCPVSKYPADVDDLIRVFEV